jgi:hypothetical protein
VGAEVGHGRLREVDDEHEAVGKVGVRAGDEDGSAGVGGVEEELAERRRSGATPATAPAPVPAPALAPVPTLRALATEWTPV